MGNFIMDRSNWQYLNSQINLNITKREIDMVKLLMSCNRKPITYTV